MNTTQIEACARAVHETNRAYCLSIGDTSQHPWDEAKDWQRSSAINGVQGVLNGDTFEQSHETWLAEKEANGWKWGPVKDEQKKEHPCIVPYDKLPPEQKAKDVLFVGIVNAMVEAYNMLG